MTAIDLRKLGSQIKVIICDLDHTLLNTEKKISPKNKAAIRAAQDKGIFVTVCSGRIPTMLETYEISLAIEGPVISTNGAAIVNSPDGKLLWSAPVDRALAIKILDYLRDGGYDYSALTDKLCYFSPNSIRIQRFHQYNALANAKGMLEIPLAYLNGNNQVIQGDILKILVQERNGNDIETAIQHLSSMEGIGFMRSEPGLLDVLSQGVDKGTGVAQVKRLLGVKTDEICVFGDYHNDIPMFAEAGFPIAVANALDEVKEAALAVTDPSDEDGVANAIYKYIL